MTGDNIALWQEAKTIDNTLGVSANDWKRLEKIHLRPRRFSVARLFDRMEGSQSIVFTDCPVTLKKPQRRDPSEYLTELILTGFPRGTRARAKTGLEAQVRYLKTSEVIRRWTSGKSLLNVTDLHIRDTRFEQGINASVLTNGNILLRGSEDVALQEMFTVLISTKGAMSDSHSDDPDGNNHCFVGKKLWLAWDTFEGKAKGLEDVSRDRCPSRAKFNMRAFLSLKSAHWFTVEKNQTLFLPGRLTHKVITLQPYIGIGCFYVTIPNCLDTLARWITHGPLWSLDSKRNDSLVNEIAAATIKVVRTLRSASSQTQERRGFDRLKRAAKRFEREAPPSRKARLLEVPAFAELMSAIGSR